MTSGESQTSDPSIPILTLYHCANVYFTIIQKKTGGCKCCSSLAKIAIRGDGKSPDQKVIDMQLQAANLVYIFDVIILSVTANKLKGL